MDEGAQGAAMTGIELPDRRSLITYGRPNLVRPNLIMGFEGWANAGMVSSGVVGELKDRLHFKKLAEIKPDKFHLFHSQGIESGRPLADVKDGMVRTLSLPSTLFWFHKDEKAAHDLVISLGTEPELRWKEYIDLVLDFAQDYGIERLYTIGGSYDNVPHSIEPILTAVISDESLKAEMTEYGVGFTDYKGPSSIHTWLVVAARERGIKAVSLWGHIPYYVQVPNAKVCYSMLSRLTKMLNIAIDFEDLRKAGEDLYAQVSNSIRQKPELESYVKRLEEDYGKGEHQISKPLEEDIIKEIEDFLRKHKDKE
ncbi:MAG: hypothetical protein A2Z70_00725 [Chloroflexi bacterium RBG_13_48_17]|nr:MAG: hypothetical protein A2Z70_00725 [Chloroflexi bacterium RBG_13_48_17]